MTPSRSEKEMATHSSVLAWRIPETEEPGRRPFMGSHRVGHDLSNLAAAASQGFPGGSTGKESTYDAGDPGWIPGSGRSPAEGIGYPLQYSWASLLAQLVKKSACNVGDLGLIPGLGRFPEEGKGYPLQYSGLENSMDCIVHGAQRVRHD